jgi:hypothetical protein
MQYTQVLLDRHLLCASSALGLACLRVRILDALLYISTDGADDSGTARYKQGSLLGMDISINSSSTIPMDHRRNRQL